MAKKLTGKVALVTGGSRGIGAATALALAEEGADVVISYAAAVAARELAARNITVNTQQAGFVDTDMNPENSDPFTFLERGRGNG